ncbi:PREDICTED: uncharacterized protein LOC109466908 [Branchiostoma belcheri]|uniref:Uncharacterized protein LOC109466908 n=1 Tax=Branchiostoma belcheri TaxID=7741 RepID=A0A6P4Y7D9_BRABE|nr:PREDICTED: uncharacterized protein LOC109466908 [Branchiostoma belcheri]
MNRQGKAVRPPVPGPDSPKTSGLPPQPRPVQQSGSRGRVRHGNGASDKQQEGQGTSPHTYEDVDGVKRYATSAGATPMRQPEPYWRSRADAAAKIPNPMYASNAGSTTILQPQSKRSRADSAAKMVNPIYASGSDGAYPGGASGRPGVCSFLRARRSWLAPGIAVLVSLCAMGLAPLTFSNKQEISTIVNAVKLDQDDIRQLSDNVDALKRDQDNISTTQNALKHDLEYERNRTATLEQRLHEIENGAHTNSSATGGGSARKKNDSPMDQPQARENDDENTPNATIPGYTRRRGICYKAFNTRKTFSEAAVACRADGGTLAMPRDAETEAFLVSLYKPVRVCDNRGFWIGLHDQREEGSP